MAKTKEEVMEEVKEQVQTVKKSVKEGTAAASATAKKASASAKKAAVKTAGEAGKAATAAKKRIAKEYAKLAMSDMYIQANGHEYSQNAILEKVEIAFAAEGHRVNLMRELKLYVKPEEGAAYYVINGKYSGRVEL